MKEKIFVITVCVLIACILAAAFCFWPMKKHEILEFHAVQVTADGTIVEQCTITWDGETKANVFQDPRYIGIRLNISNLGEYGMATKDNEGILLADYIPSQTGTGKYGTLEYFWIAQSDPSAQGSMATHVFLTPDGTVCLIKVGNAPEDMLYYIGTTDPDRDLTELLEEYRDFFS